MKRHIKYIIIFLLIMPGAAFQKKEKPDLVAQEFNRRIIKYRNEQMDLCRKNIIKEAEIYVDSIIALQMNEIFIDTIKSPPKPLRPKRPYDKLKLDSADLSPLFKEEKITPEIKE